MYTPKLKTTDLWHGVTDRVGELVHCGLLDLIAACQGPDDEELLTLLYGGHNRAGHTEKEIGDILGISQQAVSYRYQRLLRRSRERSAFHEGSYRRGTDLPRVLQEVRDRGRLPRATSSAVRSE